MIWPHASRNRRCPICNSNDWCTFGDRAVLCQRVVSEHPHPNGGWFHFYSEPTEPPKYVRRYTEPRETPDFVAIWMNWLALTNDTQIADLAELVGVSIGTIRLLEPAYAIERNCWAFPMRDGNGNIVGIRLRGLDGRKWAVSGSRQGLFQSTRCNVNASEWWICEGPTSTAATLELGFQAVGRPNCLGGADMLNIMFARLGVRRAVIVADNDPLKRFGAGLGYPGIDGAKRLAKDLNVKTVVWIPPMPFKDVRDFLRSGGTRAWMEADIKNRIWM